MNRLDQIKKWMEENRNYSVIETISEANDDALSETGRCVKYAYELLDMLVSPNDPSSATRPEKDVNCNETAMPGSLQRMVSEPTSSDEGQ
jgi:hypothetical protein